MHTFDICLDIASKMRNPQEVIASMNDKIRRGECISKEWPAISLDGGMGGMICFYGMMEINFPGEGWEEVVRDYLLIAKETVEKESAPDISLYSGLTGLSAAVHLCSCGGTRYQKMLTALDDLLIREVQTVYLRRLNSFLNPYESVPPAYYSLAHGLSGILIYLMSREDHAILKSLAQECLQSLVALLSTSKEIQGSQLPAWYIAFEHETFPEIKEKCPEGSFKLDVPNGVPGVLAALSLAKIKGFNAPGLVELIAKMADWIKDKKMVQDEQTHWNHFVSMREELEGIKQVERIRQRAWFYGAAGILRCLHLAARAMENGHLAKFSEQAFLESIQKPDREHVADLSFAFGTAGLLAMTHEMACETKNPEFFKQARVLEEEIKRHHHPHHEFGFQTFLYDGKSRLQLGHHPGLLNGAAGIGLALLQVQGRQEIQWSRPFVIA